MAILRYMNGNKKPAAFFIFYLRITFITTLYRPFKR